MALSLPRILLSGIFFASGVGALKAPEQQAPVAQQFFGDNGVELQDDEAITLIKAKGAAMFLGASALSLGIVPRLAATGLIASLIPINMAAHAFWKEQGEEAKQMQMINFLKNLGLIGGLLGVVVHGKSKRK